MPTKHRTKDGVKWRAVVKIDGVRVATKVFGIGPEQKRAAIQWEIETREAFQKKTTTHTDLPDVLLWANKYLTYAEQEHTRQTFKEKQTVFRLFFEFTKETRLDRITPNMAMDYLQKQRKERSGNAANKDRKNLAAAWEWGRKLIDGFPALTLNPFLAVPPFKVEKKPRYVPPESDFWKVVKAAQGQDKVMLLAFFFLGARRMEVFHLKWEEVDFTGNRVRLGTCKTRDGSMRYDWIPLVPDLKEALLEWREARPYKTEWVFAGLDDSSSPWHNPGEAYRARGHFMKNMCKRAGVKPFGFHAIRHLHASVLFNEGKELVVIQKQLRHTNPNTTARYIRELEGYGAEHAQKVLSVMEGRSRRTKVIPFPEARGESAPHFAPQSENPQSRRSEGSVHNASTQLPANLKATGA